MRQNAAGRPPARQEVGPSDGHRASGSTRPLVLHVVEALASGVATGLEGYLRSSPEHVHVVLGWRRQDSQTGDELARLAADVLPLPSGRLAQLRAVRRVVEELRPDIVHAHSSYAGLYARLLPGRLARTVVYTPHGFSFERRDVTALLRGLFWLAEAALSLRGACIAAVGPREVELARRLPGGRQVQFVPYVVRRTEPVELPERSEDQTAERDGERRLRLVTLGRIAPQKDPEFFRRVALLSRELELPFRWIWVGGGDPGQEQALREAGVLVTGWTPRCRALGWLTSADLYVHTAAWEGSPLSVLEAAVYGLPVVARRNPSLAALDLPVLCDTPEELLDAIRSLQDHQRRLELRARLEPFVARHSPEAQREALMRVYGTVLDANASSRPTLTPRG